MGYNAYGKDETMNIASNSGINKAKWHNGFAFLFGKTK